MWCTGNEYVSKSVSQRARRELHEDAQGRRDLSGRPWNSTKWRRDRHTSSKRFTKSGAFNRRLLHKQLTRSTYGWTFFQLSGQSVKLSISSSSTISVYIGSSGKSFNLIFQVELDSRTKRMCFSPARLAIQFSFFRRDQENHSSYLH